MGDVASPRFSTGCQGQTKRELAARDWPDTNAYAAAKTAVIESIISAARAAGEVSR